MQMQLMFDLTAKPAWHQKPIVKGTTWVDVSDIARGVGFTVPVEVSAALNDALEPLQTEDEDNYDQRLYDVLWLAHHYLSLDQRQSFTFTFDFLREDKYAGKFTEASLRLRVEVQKNLVLLGLLHDFQEAARHSISESVGRGISPCSAHPQFPSKNHMVI